MLSKVSTLALSGLESRAIDVEADISFGLPAFTIVGLGATSVQESRERVRGAIRNSQYSFPTHRITVNLVPASMRKDGSQFDLPIAVALLAANQLIPHQPANRLFFGELSLDGRTRTTRGVLSAALGTSSSTIAELYIPVANIPEVSLLSNKLKIYPVGSLRQLVGHLLGRDVIRPLKMNTTLAASPTAITTDFSVIKGQRQAKRALEIAAVGGHNVLMIGPPGAGKTTLATALPGIMPPLTAAEVIDITQIYSLAGLLAEYSSLINQRPFRAPHHSSSPVALIGGGANSRPGEISLAHRGVLFLDELLEFAPQVLEALRQPLEAGFITIARPQGSMKLPADFMLVAAANPCRCGFAQSSIGECVCRPHQIAQYRQRLSGPMLDRIDLQLELQPVKPSELVSQGSDEDSATIRQRVIAARNCRARRGKAVPDLSLKARNFMSQATEHYHLSARGYTKVIKVAQSIADLSGRDMISIEDLAEACQYRLAVG